MANSIRRLVSQKKIRYQDDGFDLDLTYISTEPTIIAMGFPASGTESVYRNPMPEVKRFLDTKHGDDYIVYNLCAESKHQYPDDAFAPAAQCADYEFEDHNVLPLPMLLEMCSHAAEFLARGPPATVAIHCKAGKGRTGLIIASLLQHLGVAQSPEDALALFADVRTSDGKGVTVPSQKRYVEYYGALLADGLLSSLTVPSAPISLTSLTMHTVPSFDLRGGCDPYMIISTFHDGELLRTDPLPHVKSEDTVALALPAPLLLTADFRIALYDADRASADDFMCYFWLNPARMRIDAPDGTLRLDRSDIDGVHKDKANKRFEATFAIDVHFTLPDPHDDV